MSKLARALLIGAMLAASNLAGPAAIAQAHAADQPASIHQVMRSPTERQVGESWRHHQVAADQPASRQEVLRPPSERQVGELWRHHPSAAGPPAEPSGQSSRAVAWLGVLAAALALSGGLAVLAAKRTSRNPRVGQAT
jgi:hypothetical protein